jgi:hypothetical protein
VHFPRGDNGEPPPAAYMICPRGVRAVLAEARALCDMQGVWDAADTQGFGGPALTPVSGARDSAAAGKARRACGQSGVEGERRRRGRGRGHGGDSQNEVRDQLQGGDKSTGTGDETVDMEMGEGEDEGEDANAAGGRDGWDGNDNGEEDQEEASESESSEDVDQDENYASDTIPNGGSGILSTGLFSAPRSGFRVSGQIEAFGRLNVDVIPVTVRRRKQC